MTQEQAVLEKLKESKTITSMDAFEVGITRLSAVIYNLRAKGYKIKSTMKTRKNRFGNVVNYSEYSLEEE